MNQVVKIVEVPEPIFRNGRAKLLGGWSTPAVGRWLLEKKLGEKCTTLSEVASFAYHRDSASNRNKVRNNIPSLRRWLADNGEFLLTQHGYQRTTISIKVCNPAEEVDRQAAIEQLSRLEARGEVTLSEAERIRHMLYLSAPNNGGER